MSVYGFPSLPPTSTQAPLGSAPPGITHTAKTQETPQSAQITSVVKPPLESLRSFFIKLDANKNCGNHSLGMRKTLKSVKELAAKLFKESAALVKKGQENLKSKIVRKFNDVVEFLNKCDFNFIRRSSIPFWDIELPEQLLKKYQKFEERWKK